MESVKFENFEKTLPNKNRYTFDIHNVDLGVINAVRRIILTNIPVVGFDGELEPSLEIAKNDGPLHNEFMMHRFGLIPIHFSEEETENFESDDYEFILEVDNKTVNTLNVTSADFTVTHKGQPVSKKDLARLFPADPISKSHVLITRLRPGESLHVHGRAIKSTAHHHAGFSPVSLCTLSFKQDPSLIASISSNVEKMSVLDKERSYFRNSYGDPTIVQFEIESETALTPKYLFSKALDILMQKLHKTISEIYKDAVDTDYVTFSVHEETKGGQFTFRNEDDTFGNFLQSLMHNHYIRDQKPAVNNYKLSYAGYYCPHPLDTTMVLRINFAEGADDVTDMDYINTLKDHCERALAYLQNLQGEWMRVAPA